jgi:hypothetical protein
MAVASAPEASREQLAQAIGSLIWKDPSRILDAIASARGAVAVLECRLRGASMGHAIPAGSRLRIDLATAGGLKAGDLVAFVRDDGICVHRIVYLGRRDAARDFVITQGDACFYPDPPVRLAQVIGPVTEFRNGLEWTRVGTQAEGERAGTRLGRTLLCIVASLTEIHVPIAGLFARMLRLRTERPGRVEAPGRE